MLTSVYQPVIGAYAASLYQLLYQQISPDQLGYSKVEQQRKIFLLLNIDPNETGRRLLIEQTSKLEAMGLLRTKHRYIVETDEYLFEYELVRPLSPGDFFKVPHLMMLLRDKVGKYAVLSLKEDFFTTEPEEFIGKTMNSENISLAFYDFEPFRLNASVVDWELEQALSELSPAREEMKREAQLDQHIEYTDIIFHFPKAASKNTRFVENLKYDHGQMASINYYFNKYHLMKADIRDLLDADGMFSEDGELQVTMLEKKANDIYRQRKSLNEQTERRLRKMDASSEIEDTGEGIPDEHFVAKEYYLPVPQILKSQCDNPDQYNMFVRNLPYTHFLEKFFPGVVPKYIEDTFEQLCVNYKLPDEVINVLIHFISFNKKSWTRSYIDSIAASLLGKQIHSFEETVVHFRSNGDKYLKKNSTSTRAQKPNLKVVQSQPDGNELKDDEMEALQRLAERLERK